MNGELYKLSMTGISQQCISPEEGRQILGEIHSGTCGHHASSRTFVAKSFRAGFFWLTAHADAVDLVQKCLGCQMYARQPHMPASELKTIPLAWSFAVWGLDMLGLSRWLQVVSHISLLQSTNLQSALRPSLLRNWTDRL